MKGKMKQRVMAVFMALLMTIGLLPADFLGGKVIQVKAANQTLDLSSASDATYTDYTAIGDFTLLANSSKSVAIKKISDISDVSTAKDNIPSEAPFTSESMCIRATGGGLAVNADKVVNGVKFTTSGQATVTVWCCAKKTTARNLVVYEATTGDSALGTSVYTSTETIDNTAFKKITFEVTSAGSYYMGASGDGIVIPYILVEEAPTTVTRTLDLSGASDATYTDYTAIGDFTLLANSSKSVAIKKISDISDVSTAKDNIPAEASFTSESMCIRATGGGLAVNADKVVNGVKFTTSGRATVTVWCCAKKATARNLVVYEATTGDSALGTSVYTSTETIDNTAFKKITFEVTSAGSYYMGANGDGIVIPYISIEEEAGTTVNPPVVSTAAISQSEATVTISGTGTPGDVDSKYVIVRVSDGGEEKTVGTTDGASDRFSIVDTLTASGTYTYKVYGKGTSESAEVNATGTATYILPLEKATVTAVADNAKVILSWSAVEEADSYDVKVYEGSTELTEKSLTGLTTTSATIEGLTNGTEYGFVVIAKRTTPAAETESTKVLAKPVAPEAGVTWLNANLLNTFKSATENYVVNDMWKIVSGGSEIKVEACDPVNASDGMIFTQRISTGGGSATGSARYAELTLTKDSYVIVYTRSSGSSARTLAITNAESGEQIQLPAVASNSTLAPSRAINLKAGTYRLHSTSGGIYIYAVKVGEGTAPRAAWSTVPEPEITNAVRNADGTVTVSIDAVFGTDGADDGIVIMYQNGLEVASTVISAADDVTFTPITEGDFTFKATIRRAGEADKESAIYTLSGYTLPLVKPTITWVNNLGNGSVYVDWNNIDADSFSIAYKSEADADYVTAATGLTEGNYTLTGLTSGMTYDIKVTAAKEGLVSESVKSITVGEPVQQWYIAAFGSATSGVVTVNGTEYQVKTATGVTPVENVTNTDGKVSIASATNGKIGDSEDGFFYYYTKVNPNTENFKLTATFTVTDINDGPDNQTGYGIYATDVEGVGSMNHKYFNSVSVGQYKMFGGYYHANGARLTTGYFSYDASNNSGAIRNLDNTHLFSAQSADDGVHLGDTYTYTLEKTNEGYVASMVGGGNAITFEGASSIMVQEDGSICVGVMAARKVGVEISNITFEKAEGSASAAAVALTEPKVNVYSTSTSAVTAYEFIASPNVNGWLDVYDSYGNKVFAGYVEADKVVKAQMELHGGYNDIRYAFAPDKNVPNLTSYGEISDNPRIIVQSWGEEGETIYVSPNGNAGAVGTETNPIDLQTALNYAQPGQTIVMLDGTYYIEKDLVIPRSVNGTEDKPITLMAQNTGKVIIDGSKQETSSSLISIVGSYWHLYGIEFTNGLGKGISVCGNYNIVEMCTIHNVGNSGLQISRYAGEPNDSAMWPCYNLVKNCEAYDCCDPGRNDADGFTAKLTCGEGNKFYGCISHNNIDDGWDLYAKSTTGPIGVVTIENCIAYSNGFLTTEDPTDPNTAFGEGNGFKLGGESMPGAHLLINSISYNNYGKGITSNSGPDCKVINCTAYNNSLSGKAYNVSLYTNKSSNPKAWVLEGMLSVVDNSTTLAELGASAGVIYSLRSESNYLYDGSKSYNTLGEFATSDWFVSTDITIKPTRNADGTIDMHGLLELKASAPANTGARLVTSSEAASVQPGVTTTVSKSNLIGFIGPAPAPVNSVNTGDTTPLMPLAIIMLVSAGICVAYVFRRKRA